MRVHSLLRPARKYRLSESGAQVRLVHRASMEDVPSMDSRCVAWSESSPAMTILAQAKERHVDFIALAVRRRTGLRRMIRPGVFGHPCKHGR
jgi:nucleotide-binding universal stress UspA family protein